MASGTVFQPSMIIDAFYKLGGDASSARSSASDFSSVSAWRVWQGSQASAVGAAAMAVPAAHIPALAVDLGVLMHKMAFCSWGVGYILGAEVDPTNDLAAILAVWSGAVTADTAALMMVTAAGKSIAATGFAEAGGKAAAKGMEEIAKFLGEKITHKGTAKASSKIAAKAGTKGVIIAAGGQLTAPIIEKLTTKLLHKAAALLAPVMTGKLAAKGVAGFIPLVGPAVGASINGWFMYRISEAAEQYYRAKKEYTG